MTTLPEAREAIYGAFETAWGATTSFTLDNEEYDPPSNANWVRVSVRHQFATQETLGGSGNRRFARLGSAFIQIFTLENTGTEDADTLATTAQAIFEGVSLTGTTVRFRDVIIREEGLDGKWYQTVVEATFEYDETK
jgi:hypothetical protein